MLSINIFERFTCSNTLYGNWVTGVLLLQVMLWAAFSYMTGDYAVYSLA